jgi:arsenate reductase-like glutaredoxin family protein
MGYAVLQEERRCKTCRCILKKLSTNAVDCALISKRATDARKKELFDRLADYLAMLASELERAIEANEP